MKIEFTHEEAPMWKSFTVFAQIDSGLLNEEKKIFVSRRKYTKATYTTDVSFGDYCAKINLPSEKFKTLKQETMSFFSGDRTVSYHFKITKKQGEKEYLEYLEEIMPEVLRLLKYEQDYINVVLLGF